MINGNLTPQSVLRRVPDLTLKIESNDLLHVSWNGKEMRCGPRALLILSTFSQPHTLSEALEQLQTVCRGAQDWIDLTSTIVKLYRAGVLRDDLKPEVGSSPATFDSAELHIRMLNDRDRTSRYLEAIRAMVKPGDIVLDLGTGTGVLAVVAAQSGADHVYAIEASSMSDIAKTTFRANGLENRITLIHGWSTQTTLPERADLLVSEILSNDGLVENVLEFTLDARKRLLKPNARCIPSRIRIFGIPVTIPEEALRRHLFTPEATQDWGSWYGVYLDHLPTIPQKQPAVIYVKPSKAAEWEFLGEPVLLTDIELTSFSGTEVETQLECVFVAPGLFNGFVTYFEAELSPDNWLTNHPRVNTSWGTNVQLIPSPLEVKKGDRYVAKFEYRNSGIISSSVTVDIRLADTAHRDS